MTLISDLELCTQNCGYISEWFTSTRGCRQGCCLSPLLYLCCRQILSHKIKENPKIKGVEIYDLSALISQFAYDKNLYLSFDEITLNAVVDTFTLMQDQIGLKVNFD